MSAVDIFDPHGDPKAQAKTINFARKGYKHLQGLIVKGLDYLRWLATRADTEETADLTAVVRQVADRMPGLAEPEVDFRISSFGVPCLVRGEERHLAEVVQVLLDNALKFSRKEKCIRVDLRATAEKVTLSVADRGQGFPPELAQELFRPFTIADVMHHLRVNKHAVNLPVLVVTGKDLTVEEKPCIEQRLASLVSKREASLGYFARIVGQVLGTVS